MSTISDIPLRGAIAVFGGYLLNVILGAIYTFGNIMPYLASYMRERTDSEVN